MSKHTLSATVAVAVATYGVILHTGAGARREFCIAVVGEAVESGASFDAIADAAKVAVDYSAMETDEQTLFRKQIQYCRAIAAGWSKLGKANQQAFVGGSLPASSAMKLLKAKAAPAAPAATDAAPAAPAAPSTEVQAVQAGVISGPEAALIVAAWLDTVSEPRSMTEAQAKAVNILLNAVDGLKARTVEAAKARKAA